MPNSNCLEGMQCPNCDSEGPFEIAATVFCTVYDDGTDDYGDVEWLPESDCICKDCGHGHNVRAFTLPPLQEYTVTVVNNNDSPVDTFKVSARSEADASKQAAERVEREWPKPGYDWKLT